MKQDKMMEQTEIKPITGKNGNKKFWQQRTLMDRKTDTKK